MAGMRIVLGGLTFPNKEAVKRYCRTLVDRARDGDWVADENVAFLRDLLACHPDVEEKLGSGLRGFVVRSAPPFHRNRCFYAVRTDGTEVDFSWKKCVEGHSPWFTFCKAARYAVSDQIVAFRDQEFARGLSRCPIDGAVLTVETSHVDHFNPTFGDLVRSFVGDTDWESVPLVDHPAGAGGRVFADPQYAARFAAFHAAHANLRVISAHANLSTLRKGVPRK